MKAKPVLLLEPSIWLLVLFVGSLLAAGIQPVQAAQPSAPAAQEEPEAERRLVIHPASFTPFYDGYEYSKVNSLGHSAGNPGPNGIYTAPVNLPYGATILRMGFYWVSTDATVTAEVYLQRTEFSLGNYINMGYIKTGTATGLHGTYDLTIDSPLIDNSKYSYWVTTVLPTQQKIKLLAVYLDYTVPATDIGIIAIPASSFQPFTDGYDYENHGRGLYHIAPADGFYMAPLTLPEGARINKVKLFTDNRLSSVIFFTRVALYLQRTELGKGNYANLVEMPPSSLLGYGSNSVSPTGGVIIDYSKYTYWLTWDPPDPSDVRLQAVVIEYTPPATQTRRVAIPAAGFSPMWGTGQWEIHGRYAINKTNANNVWSFAAPISLPQGMYISKATLHYLTNDAANSGTTAIIGDGYTQETAHSWLLDVSTKPNGTSAWRTLSTTLVRRENIDNNSKVYQLMFRTPKTTSTVSYFVAAVVLEYTTKKPTWLYMPMMKKK